jgi:hypothetical protein
MTTKQLMAQGPTMKRFYPWKDDPQMAWHDAESWRRWELLLERIEQRATDLRAARRRHRRRIGLPR